jgi:hypothetical protein
MDAMDRRRVRAERQPDPNEYLIMLEASAQRLKWSQREAAIRSGMARWRLQAKHCPFEAETQRMLESAT